MLQFDVTTMEKELKKMFFRALQQTAEKKKSRALTETLKETLRCMSCQVISRKITEKMLASSSRPTRGSTCVLFPDSCSFSPINTAHTSLDYEMKPFGAYDFKLYEGTDVL